MEAMAMKTPSVSTTVSGIPELIDNERNGLLVEPRNPDGTANTIQRFLTDPATWRTYSQNARDKMERKFIIETEAKKLETTFRNAGQ
jgi:glycosyltransferase involved in cell wall biosynthesis